MSPQALPLRGIPISIRRARSSTDLPLTVRLILISSVILCLNFTVTLWERWRMPLKCSIIPSCSQDLFQERPTSIAWSHVLRRRPLALNGSLRLSQVPVVLQVAAPPARRKACLRRQSWVAQEELMVLEQRALAQEMMDRCLVPLNLAKGEVKVAAMLLL